MPLSMPGAAIKDISSVLSNAVGEGALPGVVACAADAGGAFYSGAFGLADTQTGQKMRDDTLFFIASMTKAVTHIAVMQLVERHLLSLDTCASEFVPSLAKIQVLEGFHRDGTPILRPRRGDITLRHLLSYTAGFAYPYWNRDIKRYVEWAGLPDNVSYRTRSLELPLVSDPGDRWNYGINSEFLGRIVEHISGERLDRYFHRHIFEALGMHSTFYDVPPDQRGRIAQVHIRQPEGSLSPIALTLPENPEFYPGGVGLFTTAHDYLILCRVLLCGGTLNGQTIMRPETAALMGQNHLGDAATGPLESCDPFWSRDVNLFPGQDTQWGLGFALNTQTLPTGRAAFSMAWGGAANTFYWIDPTRGVTGVFMTSLVPFCDPQAMAAFTAYETAIYDSRG